MTHASVQSRVLRFFQRLHPELRLEHDDDIVAMGLGNSMVAMQLVEFLEREFSIQIPDDALHLDNFRTLNAITELVSSRQGKWLQAA